MITRELPRLPRAHCFSFARLRDFTGPGAFHLFLGAAELEKGEGERLSFCKPRAGFAYLLKCHAGGVGWAVGGLLRPWFLRGAEAADPFGSVGRAHPVLKQLPTQL